MGFTQKQIIDLQRQIAIWIFNNPPSNKAQGEK